MRVILRLDAYPPDLEGADEGGMFGTMIGQLRSFLDERYKEWEPVLTVVVGYADSEKEGHELLKEKWVTR